MNLAKRIFIMLVAFAVITGGCKEAYDPPVIDAQDQYLIVEGMLLNGSVTSIRLTRSRPLNDDLDRPELKALVNIESEKGTKFTLTDNGNGNYTTQLNLNAAEKYRLYIKTSAGKEYLSDFVNVLITPEIEKISWKKTGEGINILADTRDPANKTRFYRWGFEETWLRRIPFTSSYEYVNGQVQPRAKPTNRTCYDTYENTPLAIASTLKLSEDVVHEAHVTNIPLGSSKLIDKYSILVKQYALEEDAYEYWQAMKKNTETMGSIFDPQPSYMYGNIRSVSNPKELVIGFFGACSVTEKRIFITRVEAEWIIPEPVVDPTLPPSPDPCELRNVASFKPNEHRALFDQAFGSGIGQRRWIPVSDLWDTPDGGATFVFVGYSAVERMDCVDCGPNNVMPSWWK